MAAATTQEITAAMAANLSTKFTDPWTVTSYWPISPNIPALGIEPAHPTSVDYHEAMNNGAACLYFIVHAVVQTGADVETQALLQSLLDVPGASDNSVAGALETDTTLGGIVAGLQTVKCSGLVPYNVKGSLEASLGLQFTVKVTV